MRLLPSCQHRTGHAPAKVPRTDAAPAGARHFRIRSRIQSNVSNRSRPRRPASRDKKKQAVRQPRCYVYLVGCADGTVYTGWTLDVARRFEAHQKGRGARYTRTRRPLVLLHQECLPSRGAAMRREAEIKRWPHARKVRLVQGDGKSKRRGSSARSNRARMRES